MIPVDPSTVLGSGEVAINILRFLIVFVSGAVLTRIALMPLVERAVSRKAARETSHSIVNFSALTGLFISFTVALQAGSFGGLASIIGAIAAALTVAVGFGMRDQVSNIMAGEFVKGDYIQVNEESGVVVETNLRGTTIKDSKSQKTVIPNAMITGNPTTNYTRDRRTRSNLSVKFDAEKADEAEKLLKKIAEEHEELLEKPEPEVRFRSEGPEAVLHYWIKNPSNKDRVKSELTKRYLLEAPEKQILEQEKD
jgi:small conductance mechanosensitive channel